MVERERKRLRERERERERKREREKEREEVVKGIIGGGGILLLMAQAVWKPET